MPDKIEVQQAALDKRVSALEKSLDATKKDMRAVGDAGKNAVTRDDLTKLANRIAELEKAMAVLASTKKDVKSIEEQQKKTALAVMNKAKADTEKIVADLKIDVRFRQLQADIDTVRAIALKK